MMIKCFTKNNKGLIEFTPSELETLLNEVYNQGYSDASIKNYWWYSPDRTYWTCSNTTADTNITLNGTTTSGSQTIKVEAT